MSFFVMHRVHDKDDILALDKNRSLCEAQKVVTSTPHPHKFDACAYDNSLSLEL